MKGARTRASSSRAAVTWPVPVKKVPGQLALPFGPAVPELEGKFVPCPVVSELDELEDEKA
jgi:hypothetical protein